VGHGDTLQGYLDYASSAGEPVRYVGFDTFADGHPQGIDGSLHNTSMEAIRSIGDGHDYATVDLHKGPSDETVPKVAQNLQSADVIHIDGGHEYETVRSDWESIQPMIGSGTIVVFDDVNCEPGVSKAVGEILAKNDEFEHVAFTPGTPAGDGCVAVSLVFPVSRYIISAN